MIKCWRRWGVGVLVYVRWVKKGDKVYGPYFYETVRDEDGKTRVIYLMSVSSSQGKEQRAMFRIVDELIRDYSGSNFSLDFEGSNIPSIARFFGGFGGRPEVYQSLSFNRLSVPLILGKRYGK